MREINLQEYQPSAPVALSGPEREALRGALQNSVAIAPAEGSDGAYILTPGATIGAVSTGDFSVSIAPKIGIPQVLSLACYAMGKVHFRKEDFDFPEEYALPDALAIALAGQARRAFAGGLPHGYRAEEEALYTVRGRIRFDEQLRRRFGVALPVAVGYDEFTADILPNRLVKAAARRLRRAGLRSGKARRGLGWLAAMLEDVAPVEFPATAVPSVGFDRLNEHCRGVVELSRLVLRHGAFEAGRGPARAAGFLMDMNAVFQEFATQALREALGLSGRAFRSESAVHLDEDKRVTLRPDFSWWERSSCVFVGDAKYKNLAGGSVPNADLYQLLAYATALNLPGGLLVYAKGEAGEGTYRVRHSGKRLEVAALDLSGALEDVLAGVKGVAERVVALRAARQLGWRREPHHNRQASPAGARRAGTVGGG